MNTFKRYSLKEISYDRILTSIGTRAREIPHSLIWKYSSLSSRNRVKIEKYKGLHNGEQCYIVANGPSLQKTNLDILKDDITFGLNRIYLSFENTSFRPTYYIAMNELILDQFSGEIEDLDMPKFLNWNHRRSFNQEDPMVTFLKSKLVLQDTFQRDITKPMVVGGTVTFVALQIAYYMGFRKVILIGLDHYYADKGIPNRTETREFDIDKSHFHTQYFPKGLKWQLPDLLRSELDYRIAREAYERDGREIIDATIGGKCQVFKKADYLFLTGEAFVKNENSSTV
jgi:hypothetical protein